MNMTLIKTLHRLMLLLLLMTTTTLWAQRERNYIYILDCSNSMVSDFHILEPTLRYLRADIDRLSPQTMVTIIPFQGSVYDKSVRHQLKKDFDWAKFEKEVTPYTEQRTGTNICQAWDRALTYIDTNKDNYIYLLTDGRDNKNPRPDGTDSVCRRIREWCGTMAHTQGYYVALSDEAIDERIRRVVEECPHMVSTSDIEKPFGTFDKTEMWYNTLDPHDVVLPFSAEGEFRTTLVSDTPGVDLELEGGLISNGRAKVHIQTSEQIKDMPEEFTVMVKASSQQIEILNPELTLHVRNIPERSLQLPVEQIDLGEAEWYDKFWWKDAKPMDTLCVDLAPQFNASAIKSGSSVRLQFTETTTDDNGHPLGLQSELLVNGKPCSDGMIDVVAGKPLSLALVPRTDSREGKHYYALRVVEGSRHNLETINQESPADYELTLRSAYDVDTNPLKVLVIVLSLIVLGLLSLWMLVLKPLCFRGLKIFSVTVSDPYFSSIPVHNALYVVFTSRPRKQGLMERIFMGRVIYEVNPIWEHEWTLRPSGRSATIMASAHSVDPLDYPLELGTEYRLTDNDDPTNKAVISIA